MDLFTPIKESKKLLEKLKKCCSTISKYNLNSPCLLQFMRINGEFEVILSHDAQNGNKFNFYKIFETVTYDDFKISEEDSKYFKLGDNERTSLPIIVSSVKLDEDSEEKLKSKRYDYSQNSFYIFPKFVYEAIKEDIIESFEVMNDDISVGLNHRFTININLKPDQPRFIALFIPNSNKLTNLFNMNVIPFDHRNMVNSIIYDLYSKQISSFITLNKDEWNAIYEKNIYNDSIVINGNNDHRIILYHNDFIPKSLNHIYVSKMYESTDNIVTLNLKIEISGNMFIYLKYKYYEL